MKRVLSFNKKLQSFIVTEYDTSTIPQKRIRRVTYAISVHGPFAGALAQLFVDSGVQLKQWFITDGETIAMYKYTQWGLKRLLIDHEDKKWMDKFISVAKNKTGNDLYYATVKKKKLNKFLHREIMNPPDNLVVDHKNHDGLDNRKENLRIVTQRKNTRNQSVRQSSTTGHVGVRLARPTCYESEIRDFDGTRIRKTFSLKRYGSMEHALEAAVTWRKEMENKYYKC